jgi:hypothetical protein
MEINYETWRFFIVIAFLCYAISGKDIQHNFACIFIVSQNTMGILR